MNFTGTVEVSLPYGFKVTSTNNVYNDEYRGTQTTNRFYGQYKSSNGIVYKTHGRTKSFDLQQMLNWAHQYGQNNISAVFGLRTTSSPVQSMPTVIPLRTVLSTTPRAGSSVPTTTGARSISLSSRCCVRLRAASLRTTAGVPSGPSVVPGSSPRRAGSALPGSTNCVSRLHTVR